LRGDPRGSLSLSLGGRKAHFSSICSALVGRGRRIPRSPARAARAHTLERASSRRIASICLIAIGKSVSVGVNVPSSSTLAGMLGWLAWLAAWPALFPFENPSLSGALLFFHFLRRPPRSPLLSSACLVKVGVVFPPFVLQWAGRPSSLALAALAALGRRAYLRRPRGGYRHSRSRGNPFSRQDGTISGKLSERSLPFGIAGVGSGRAGGAPRGDSRYGSFWRAR